MISQLEVARAVSVPAGYTVTWRAGFREDDLTGSVYEGDSDRKPTLAGIFFKDAKPLPVLRLAERGVWDATRLYELSEYAIKVARALREHGLR